MTQPIKIGIDFGITNTDVVVSDNSVINFKTFPSKGASIAFLEEILNSCVKEMNRLKKIGVTGGKHMELPKTFKNVEIDHKNEIDSIVNGATRLFNPSEKNFMVMSLGSGSACAISKDGEVFHAGGTGLGGGTIRGLSKLIIDEESPKSINSLSMNGNKEKVDLLLKDVISGPIGNLPESSSAVNFGRSDYSECSREDLAAGIISMVGQTILKTAITSAALHKIEKIYVIGRTQKFDLIREMLLDGFKLADIDVCFGQKSEYAICLGAI